MDNKSTAELLWSCFAVTSMGWMAIICYCDDPLIDSHLENVRKEAIENKIGDYYLDEQSKERKFGWIINGEFAYSKSLNRDSRVFK